MYPVLHPMLGRHIGSLDQPSGLGRLLSALAIVLAAVLTLDAALPADRLAGAGAYPQISAHERN
jgi:hypothetical protein